NNGKRFSKENSNSEYSDSEYSNLELLIYKSENSNEEKFNNKKIKLNKEEIR
ncbi:4163_t:CDS:1, partial [Cetraspora pellucida]